MAIDTDHLKSLLAKWQDILRLRDWDIKVELMDSKWRKSGDIEIDAEDKKAILLINESPKSDNLEELVVHELLHLKLWDMDQMIEMLINLVYGESEKDPKREFAYAQFMKLLESTVEDLTKGYLVACGSKQELSFGRLRSQVEEETAGG
ncbi:MAG: hypothetical protein IMF26_05150 [Candidatus Fermentithermobacillus carboniphilus]|uniref:Uncharacterized protein n=1 Tax=Candidatus Fermentithermobacillus carboniphilus TaxID=3085328 RepID=A0AAT9LEH7_9FIRM|nr:MAG: hypothetical protein IMF26_05150 [Candidatus Fermentithermobacillus carboniphilus]